MIGEKREQVFVSSTYVDLREERQEVIQTLLEADCIPAGMELFPASDEDKWTLIKRVIDDSDYYLVIVGGRYGSIDPEREISYTEMEFDYAVETNKPVLAFLHGSPGSIPGDKLELGDEAREKLEAFRSKAEARMVKYWTSPSELGGQVAKSLIQIRKTHPAEGWVRARNAITPEVEREVSELRARVAELTSQLEQSKTSALASTTEFSQGDDSYTLSLWLHYWPEELVEAGKTYEFNSKTSSGTVDVTWNQVLAELGPHMMDECTEADLVTELNRVSTSTWVASKPELPKDFGKAQRVTAAATVIQDIKVQFVTLGLIEQSERRRAVTDNNTYWTLTSEGRAALLRLRAIRRPLSEEPAPASDVEQTPAGTVS